MVAGCSRAPLPQTVYDQIVERINHGDLKRASSEVDRALARYCSQGPDWCWRFRILKAQVLVSQSEPKDALALLQADLPGSLGSSDVAVRRIIYQGIAYRLALQFDRSEEKLREAERLAAAVAPQLLCEALNARGALEAAQGKNAPARETLLRALELSRAATNHRQEASVLLNLAMVEISLERFDDALDRSQAALGLSRSLDMQSLVGTNLGNLAWAYHQLGDFDNALDFYRYAVESSEKTGLRGNRLYWQTGIASVYIAKRDYASPEALLLDTLQSARQNEDAQTIIECLNDLARIKLATGRVDEAEGHNREALQTEDAGDDPYGRSESLILAGHIAAARKQSAEADCFYRRVLDDRTETPLRWEAQAGLARLRDAEGQAARAEQLYRQAIGTIESARQSIGHDDLRLSFLSSGIEVYGEYIDFLIRQGRPDDALQQADLSRARTLAEGLSSARTAPRAAPRVAPQELARRLRSTVLVYWLGETHSYLWAITPTTTKYFTLPPASEIDPLVKKYRDLTLKSTDLLASAAEAGRKLYATLVAPAEQLVPPGSRVVLLPDSSLYGLNFETLVVPGPAPHFWIEDVTLATASSLGVLEAAAGPRRLSGSGNLLLLGDAVPVPEFGALPQAAVEMRKVAGYFPGKRHTLFAGPAATPKAYAESRPGRYAYVHFVAHGTASRARPLESAVILSREGQSETYKLYARDIIANRLEAELVTISACNGSGTRAYSGEGLVGLSWAFLRAGAHHVIGALWEVSDVSTPDLMDRMYAELASGKDPATALRNAKLSFVHGGNVFAKPFYWAPFQIYTGS